MSEVIIRNPLINELPALRNTWKNIFGSIGEESFFSHYYDPQLCMIAAIDNIPAAVGYLIPFGNLLYNGESIPCAMIYSIATLPDYRNMGLGSSVVRELIRLGCDTGYPVSVLCPLEDSLFNYYSKRTGFHDWFYINERIIKVEDIKNNSALQNDLIMTQVIEISIEEYISIRENLLIGTTHIKHDINALKYQSLLCKELGGGFYKIGNCCAVIECQTNGVVWVKELLTSEIIKDDFDNHRTENIVISSIKRAFPADEYIIRTPVKVNQGRRFGMIAYSEDIKNMLNNTDSPAAPWYGMAFD